MTVDKWKELSPPRELMLRSLLDHGGIGEYSASLSFRRGDISWAKRKKLVDVRPFRNGQELYVTATGEYLLKSKPRPRS